LYLDLPRDDVGGWPTAGLVMRRHEPSLQQVILASRQQGRRLSPQLATAFSRNILDALEGLHHDFRLVHRDLKPSNILLRLGESIESNWPDPSRGPGRPDIADLDCAVAQVSDLGTITRRGEPALFALGQDGWKAPELFDPVGSAHPDREHLPDPSEDMY